MEEEIEKELSTPCLFGEDFNEEAWKKEWIGMPEFVQEDFGMKLIQLKNYDQLAKI